VIVDEFPVPAGIRLGPKTLLMLTPGRLVSEADAACGLLAPFVLVTFPIPIVLVRLASTFIVTLSVSEQLAEAARFPPLKENEVSPGVALMLPPHVPTLRLAGLAIDMPQGNVLHPVPCGKLSVNAIPLSATLLGLDN
jgi:hypothetical protein